MIDILPVSEISRILNGKEYFPCTVPWTRLEERELGGDFWFCCWIQKELGTIRKNSSTSFLTLWNDSKARQIRDGFVKKNCLDFCPRDCVGFTHPEMGFYDYPQEEFDSFSDSFKENVSKIARAVEKKDLAIDAKPIRLKLHPTSICNLRCPMCNVHCAKPEEIGETYTRTIYELIPYLNDLNVFGGEPFFCKLSREIIFSDAVKNSPQVHVSTITNATMLNQALLERLSELRLGQFVFSVDSVTKENYEKIRLGAKYETVMENIRRFVRYRDEGRLRIRHVGISCAVQGLNYGEIPQIVEFCHDLGIDTQFNLVFGSSELRGKIPDVIESVKQGIAKARELKEDEFASGLESVLDQLPEYGERLDRLHWTDTLLNAMGRHRVMLFFQKHQRLKRFVKRILGV